MQATTWSATCVGVEVEVAGRSRRRRTARAAPAVREPMAPSMQRSPGSARAAELERPRRRSELAPVADHLGQRPRRAVSRVAIRSKSSGGQMCGAPSSCTIADAGPGGGLAAPRRIASSPVGRRRAGRTARRGRRGGRRASTRPVRRTPSSVRRSVRARASRKRGGDAPRSARRRGRGTPARPPTARSSSSRVNGRCSGQRGLVPAEAEDDRQPVEPRVRGERVERLVERAAAGEVERRRGEAGLREVHVGVDEGRGDQPAVELDDPVGVVLEVHRRVVVAGPDDRAVLDAEGGGVRVGGRVDVATAEQDAGHRHPSLTAGARTGCARPACPRSRDRA